MASLVFLLLPLLILAVAWPAQGAVPGWSGTGPLAGAREYHTTTLPPNGKVLVAGGSSSGWLNSAAVYDPATGTWSPTANNLTTARDRHTATLLPNGKVLVAGGMTTGFAHLNSAELYDPATNSWTTVGAGTMSKARSEHTATLLPNGKVLVAGGVNDVSPYWLNSAELYDPATGNWTTALTFTSGRRNHTATLLPNGKVLVAGGEGSPGGGTVLSSAVLYTPSYTGGAGAWAAAGSLGTGRRNHTATLLPNGKVLAAGGYDSGGTALSSAELYTPADTGAGSWTTSGAGTLVTGRGSHTAALLPNGKVLVAGGYGGGYLSSAELYDPATGWTTSGAGTLATGRIRHTATLLPNGKVLVAGGENVTGSYLNSAELYTPMDWKPTAAPLNSARSGHTATLLGNGQVLAAGGQWASGFLNSAEVYDPASGIWSATATNLTTARGYHTATLLPNGKVLVAGGSGSDVLASAELYDPANPTTPWSSGNAMTGARYLHTATLLPNGKVLVAGGSGEDTRLNSAQLYNPSTNSWSSGGTMSTARSAHTATLLPNGKVLVAGGLGTSVPLASAELRPGCRELDHRGRRHLDLCPPFAHGHLVA